MNDEKQGPTTHAPWGAGHPHLILTSGESRMVVDLVEDETTIGSVGGNTIELPGADPVHATISHDERDEYVLTLHGEGDMNSDPSAAGTHDGDSTETLRTGASFTIGPWRLVFQREEFADHGRPYGGRQGGEYSDQPAQPRRPDYAEDPDGSVRPPGEEIDEH
jgi:hypothetical protein